MKIFLLLVLVCLAVHVAAMELGDAALIAEAAKAAALAKAGGGTGKKGKKGKKVAGKKGKANGKGKKGKLAGKLGKNAEDINAALAGAGVDVSGIPAKLKLAVLALWAQNMSLDDIAAKMSGTFGDASKAISIAIIAESVSAEL